MSHESDSDTIIMSLRDWRLALRTPPSYRVGNSNFRIHTRHLSFVFVFVLTVLFIFYYLLSSSSHTYTSSSDFRTMTQDVKSVPYNSTYPLTRPIRTPTGISYRIALISDLDTKSKNGDIWIAYLQKGFLSWNPSLGTVTVSWDREHIVLESALSQGGRGMELSELTVFNGKLYAFDDRTGVIYEIIDKRVVPWVVLTDGDGKASKGFKSEWATVRDQTLYVGGLGKEWTNNKGEIINFDPQWVKTVSPKGEVNHLNWRDNYLAIRDKAGITYPGYMIHESCSWSQIHNKWFFLPRRCSKQSYRDDTDELMGTNLMFESDSYFKDIKLFYIGDVVPSHGFSSFKFVPGSDDGVIVAIKSEEVKSSTATYIMAFTIDGKILMAETKIADVKYEGIEFI